MKCLYSNNFIKLDSFCDYHIEVTLSESLQGFTTKDIYIPLKAHIYYQLCLLEGYI